MMMQELNTIRLSDAFMTIESESCQHQPVYFGVINISLNQRTIGSVDVWRCVVCKKRFCEEKQLGIETITEIVGMPKIEFDQKWAVIICNIKKEKEKWKLVKLRENEEIKHECLDEKVVSLKVNNFKIDDNTHWSFLVDDNVNKAVEI